MEYKYDTWEVIKLINWGELVKENSRQDAIDKGKEILKTLMLSDEEFEFHKNKIRLYRKSLEEFINGFSLLKFGKSNIFPNNMMKRGVGDDGFWDLCAHIIGLGYKVHESIINDPMLLINYEDEYVENFEYIFINIE